MPMKQYVTLRCVPWPRTAAAALALLAAASSAQAQTSNTGTANPVNVDIYTGDVFQNTATGSFANTGSTITYAGASAGTFVNNGTYTAVLNGSNAALDQFIGPNGAAGLQEIAGSVAPAFYKLTFANGSGQPFTISNTQGVDVANLLTLQNGITTTTPTVAGAIRLASDAAVASTTLGTGTYVDGYVAKAGTTTFTYPLGATNTSAGNTTPVGSRIYSPITFTNPGGTAVRYIAGATPAPSSFASQPANLQLTHVSTNEYYPIGTVGAPAGSAITIPYGNFGPSSQGTPYVSDPTLLTIAAYDGTNWTNLSNTTANTIDTGAKTVTVTLPAPLSSSYSALALASTSHPLPVELIAFSAVRQGPDGLLSWQTASELHSASFLVQASTDGQTWQTLGQVAATGNSSSVHGYQFLDRTLSRYGVPLLYYRLCQLDLNATATYSPVVTLRPEVAAWAVTAYPNPYETDLTAQLTSSESGTITVSLLDATGRLVLRRQLTATPGNQLILLDEAHNFPTGTYTLLVRQNAHLASLRIIRK
jgi:hypothetical protein